jgi:hypothetical protein
MSLQVEKIFNVPRKVNQTFINTSAVRGGK